MGFTCVLSQTQINHLLQSRVPKSRSESMLRCSYVTHRSFPSPVFRGDGAGPSVHRSSRDSEATSRTSYNKSDNEAKFRREALENPADALRILAAAIDSPPPHHHGSIQPTLTGGHGITRLPGDISRIDEGNSEGGSGSLRWGQWIPVRDGLITAEEAEVLLAL